MVWSFRSYFSKSREVMIICWTASLLFSIHCFQDSQDAHLWENFAITFQSKRGRSFPSGWGFCVTGINTLDPFIKESRCHIDTLCCACEASGDRMSDMTSSRELVSARQRNRCLDNFQVTLRHSLTDPKGKQSKGNYERKERDRTEGQTGEGRARRPVQNSNNNNSPSFKTSSSWNVKSLKRICGSKCL